MLPDARRVSMLDLDRHLSQVLEQARDAPVCVQRYGQPWVWLLSSDRWFQATRWAALETRDHPLMRLRDAVDPLLATWPWPTLSTTDATLRRWQRTALLVHLRALDDLQRLHDGLRFNVLYRDFVGMDEASAWTMAECRSLLDALRNAALQRCLHAVLGAVPPVLVHAARCRRSAMRQAMAVAADDQPHDDGRCVSN
ncbi:hypothetical protein [Stenotrophomonas sp. PD6]|uniref:hypothetical protein n=1 Tax=Stenotrophomonas sp. PD6 TaxID=3368612 RepID=UPI003BA1B2ED